MSKKNKYDYFESMAGLVKVSAQASKYMAEAIESFDGGISEAQIDDAHAIEHDGDQKKHELMNHLLTEFITPVDREDIVGIAHRIDDVTDAVEDVMLKLYMFHVTEIRSESREFAELIVRCCDSLKALMKEFHHFKKPGKLSKLMIEVHDLEGEGDALYAKAMRRLFTEEPASPVELIVWTELFRRMEICLDTMEHVADMVEVVIMKNS